MFLIHGGFDGVSSRKRLTTAPEPAIVDVMTYPGGKGGSGVAQTLINLMPPHNVYIEAFLGAGAVLHAKRPARSHNVGIDVARVSLDLTVSEIEKTHRWDLISPEVMFPADNVGSVDVSGVIDVSGDAYRRTTPKLTLLQGDSIEWLKKNGRWLPRSSLVYCDPPYVRSTRMGTRDLYEFEMSDSQHLELLEVLKTLDCMVLLSGYASDLYLHELSEWNHLAFHTTNRAGTRTTEHVWFNYPKPVELHDYRYLGVNFRERERIKRKVKRWKGKLEKMPELEKQALLCALRT